MKTNGRSFTTEDTEFTELSLSFSKKSHTLCPLCTLWLEFSYE
jgi:hypothetical protein